MNNVDTTKTITHISLCSGYGGIDIGLARAIPNLRTICFCEREAFAIANLVSKMEKGHLDTAPIWTDLTTFPWGKFRGAVDIISGGFPCQPFSAAGKRNADTDERHLFPYILQGIRECQPRIVFLENVEGIISAKLSGDGWTDPAGTPVLLHVLRELERVGYKSTAGIFSASEVGAPHQRKRVFILAYNKIKGLERYRGLEQCQIRQNSTSSSSRELVNTNSNGGREVREICQGTNGSVIECNGKEGRVELANSEDKRWNGGISIDRNDGNRISFIASQIQSMVRGETQGCCGDSREAMANTNIGGQPSSINPRSSSKKDSRGQSNSIKTCGVGSGRREAMANSGNNTNTTEGLCQEGSLQEEYREEICTRVVGGTNANLWPSRPGQPQYWWEPPRVVANTMSGTCKESRRTDRELLPESARLSGWEDKGETRQISGSCSEGIVANTRHNTSERWSTLGEVQEGYGCTEAESKGSRSKRQRKESESVCSSPESQVGNTSSLRLECTREQGGLAEEVKRTKGKRSKSTSTSEESSHTSIGETTINEVKSEMGRDIDGPSSRMVLTELYTTSDSRNDELRLLGNGVVPQTCTKAFIILFDKLMNEGKVEEEQGLLNL